MEGTTLKVVARTYEIAEVADKMYGGNEKEAVDSLISDSTVFSGKAAGVCYMADNYTEVGIQNEAAAISRAKMTDKNTHHSTYDHAHVTLLINSNKMIAMILNSLGCYATSEKSARYTKMHPESDLELKLYEKWLEKFKGLVMEAYPWYDDAELTKRLAKRDAAYEGLKIYAGELVGDVNDNAKQALEELKKSTTLPSYKTAQENARYMISVFTPTTFMYTISVRRVFEIAHMLRKLYINCLMGKDTFSKKLAPHVLSAAEAFEEVANNNNVHGIQIRDSKNQYIRFLTAQHTGDIIYDASGEEHFEGFADLSERIRENHSVYGDSYDITYYNSLASLAQMQRHRTIDYTMVLSEAGEFGFVVPELVKTYGLTDEWLSDIKSVAYCVPQGTIVRIREQAKIYDFALKCKERMCGRAQLETMKRVEETIRNFINNSYNLTYDGLKTLEGITKKDERTNGLSTCARCKFKGYRCTEGCVWGSKNALTRLI